MACACHGITFGSYSLPFSSCFFLLGFFISRNVENKYILIRVAVAINETNYDFENFKSQFNLSFFSYFITFNYLVEFSWIILRNCAMVREYWDLYDSLLSLVMNAKSTMTLHSPQIDRYLWKDRNKVKNSIISMYFYVWFSQMFWNMY